LRVIPNPLFRVRNLSGFEAQKKEGFLTRRSGFGMTTLFNFFKRSGPRKKLIWSGFW